MMAIGALALTAIARTVRAKNVARGPNGSRLSLSKKPPRNKPVKF